MWGAARINLSNATCTQYEMIQHWKVLELKDVCVIIKLLESAGESPTLQCTCSYCILIWIKFCRVNCEYEDSHSHFENVLDGKHCRMRQQCVGVTADWSDEICDISELLSQYDAKSVSGLILKIESCLKGEVRLLIIAALYSIWTLLFWHSVFKLSLNLINISLH